MSRPYWWIDGESVEELKRRLNENANPRLEVRLGDGMGIHFRVVDADKGGDASAAEVSRRADINDSHICPPFCP